MNDEIVDQIRTVRRELEAKYGSSDQYFAHLQSEQQKQRSRVVRLSPRPIVKRKIA
jgi:hypothetical protein